MGEWRKTALELVVRLAPDLLFCVALTVMCFGFWLAWPPLGPIAFGGVICLPMLISRMRGGND